MTTSNEFALGPMFCYACLDVDPLYSIERPARELQVFLATEGQSLIIGLCEKHSGAHSTAWPSWERVHREFGTQWVQRVAEIELGPWK